MNQTKYTDQDKRDYLDIAQELGHARAMRELQYPKSWNTANQWAKDFGVSIPLDELKARARAHRDFYETEELLTVAQAAIDRAMDFLDRDADLSADDLKKVVDAMGKAIDKHLLISGKVTSRSGQEVAGDPFEKLLEASLRAQENADDLRDQAH